MNEWTNGRTNGANNMLYKLSEAVLSNVTTYSGFRTKPETALLLVWNCAYHPVPQGGRFVLWEPQFLTGRTSVILPPPPQG